MTAVMETGICLYDQTGLICSWSNVAQELLGYSEGELVGQPILKIFPGMPSILGSHTMELMTKNEGFETFIVERSEDLTINGMGIVVVTFVSEQSVVEEVTCHSGALHREEQSGVYDAESLRMILSNETKKTIRYKQDLSIVAVRINGYDEIDERHGNGSTDLIVQTLAIILKNETRDVDIIGRLFNELFVVCLPSTGVKAACNVATRIAKVALRYSDDETPFTIKTYSAGVQDTVDDWKAWLDDLIT